MNQGHSKELNSEQSIHVLDGFMYDSLNRLISSFIKEHYSHSMIGLNKPFTSLSNLRDM